MSITRDDLADVPDDWALERYTEGASWSDPDYAEWRYTPRPELVVRVVRRTTSTSPAYIAERENRIHCKQYATHTPGFEAHVTLARRLINGVGGISSGQLARRLAINGSAAHSLANRAATFEDVIELYQDADQDVTYIDGVGTRASEALEAAIAEDVLTTDAVHVARNPQENEDKTAVYQLIPTLEDTSRAWRVRKEWRRPDGSRYSTVFLPVEQANGAVYSSFKTAAERAREFAYDRADAPDAVETDSITPPDTATGPEPAASDTANLGPVHK
jgi:hypothetical protein